MVYFCTLADINESIATSLLQYSPVRATNAGQHDYDAMLDSADKAVRAEHCKKLGEFIGQLSRIDSKALSFDDQIDLQILTGNLNADLELEQNYRRWDRDPSLPLEISLYGCLSLIMHEFAPFEDRMTALSGRMSQIPRLLKESTANLIAEEEIPTVWAEMAEDLCGSATGFLNSVIADIAPKSNQKDLLIASAQKAIAEVGAYEKLLREKLVNRSRGSYAIRSAGFVNLLKNLYGIDTSLQELLEIGEAAITRIQAEIAEVGRDIDAAKTSDEILAEMKLVLPSSPDLLQMYRVFVASTENFLRSRDLVTMPQDAALEVVDTPEFVRHTYPFAAYSTPSPLDSRSRGQFWVTPVDVRSDGEALEMSLRNHNPFQAHLITIHEGWPGHHLQLTISSRLESKTRKLFDSNVFVEGWALYCEEMMWEQGYFPDKRYRLMQLYLELWRACRVVIDVALHCGDMSFTDAVNLLVEVAKLDKLSAIAEVKRYSQSPTQPLSYLIGKTAIMGLRTECQQKWKNEFSLKRFHDRLLATGSVPLNLARSSLLEQL